MCGICGFNWNDPQLVTQMAEVIRHRGPDQDNIFCHEDFSFGHRRLSIIDLSEQGRQPMFNEDRSIALVLNGEIYNYKELKARLERLGHIFMSQSDSEVVIHAYEEWGLDAIEKLQGMFAFAIHDIPQKRTWLVRDRIGIKPLYYYCDKGKLIFASEIKAILEHQQVPRRVNHQALFDYMGFEFVSAPETMFADVQKLPAGHFLLFQDSRATVQQYWDLSFNHPQYSSLKYEEAVEKLRELLDESVKSHLMSDVPLGVFLSGGLDSSTIVAMMRRHVPGRLRTYTIGYKDKTYSEMDYAQQVAEYFETEHEVLMIDGLKPDYVEQALWHLDEPMTDLSAIPLYLVCREAKKQITVCLSGEGGDESFAGYDRFKASRIDDFFRYIPESARQKLIGRLLERIPDQAQKKGLINMLKRFVEGANLPRDGRHLRWQYFLNTEHELDLFSSQFKEAVLFDPFRKIREFGSRCDATDKVNREVYIDMRYMMSDSVLMKVDKMSMASALEVRVPLLDHLLVEYVAALPGKWKLNGLETKHIFRSALEGILPDNIVHRGKQGYSLPVKHLLREDLKAYMIMLLNESPVIRENMHLPYVTRLIDQHIQGSHNHNHILWAMMNVAIWYNRFFRS